VKRPPFFIGLVVIGLALAVGSCSTPSEDPYADIVVGGFPETSGTGDGGTVGVEESVDDGCCPAGVCHPGETCREGRCHPAPATNRCYVDGECQLGQRCEDATQCACGDTECTPQMGSCRWPEGCCNGHDECATGENCHQGVCRTAPGGEQCWLDLHCKVGEVCEQVDQCPCGVEGCQAAPGRCSLPGICCLSDDECGTGRCVGSRCYPTPETGRCYAQDDCPGVTTCIGAYVCPCGDTSCLIPTTAGICTGAEVCCSDASDCAVTQLCVEGRECVPAPAGGGCYLDEHCGMGRVCQGAALCECDGLCPTGTSAPGSCFTKTLSCTTDEHCQPGMRCAIPDVEHCPGAPDPTVGVCVEVVDGGCWATSDCGYGEHCAGESVCTNLTGCTQPNTPGDCMAYTKLDDCCDSHLDCGDGFQCRNSNTTMTCPPGNSATCVPLPTNGEDCWNYMDCLDGQVCNQAYICSCGARCVKSRPGWCGSPLGQTCKTNIDCGTGSSCAIDSECKINPCFNNNNCPIAGKCKPKQAGQCWGHEECGLDEYCQGLRLCPNDTECPDPDTSGQCSPLEPAGECCETYKACEAGLRCISTAYMTGCVLDVSAVCVPRKDQLAGGTCFTDGDCSDGRSCQNVSVCACGLAGCETPPNAGQCVLMAP
jgi:hypothetical protein